MPQITFLLTIYMTLNRNWLWLLGVVIIAFLAWYFSDIVTFVLIAWVLSLIGAPLMRFFTRKLRFGRYEMGRPTAAVLTLATFYLGIAVLLLLFIPKVVEQSRHFATLDFGQIESSLAGPLAWLDGQLHRVGFLQPNEKLLERATAYLQTLVKPSFFADVVGRVFGVAGNIAVTFASVSFILYFFLVDNQLFEKILHNLAPEHLESKIIHTVTESSRMLTRYFIGLLTQVTAVTVILLVFLTLLGIPNAFLIAFFGGIMNLVPYLGPMLGLIFGVFITLSSNLHLPFGSLWPLLAKVAGSFGVMQGIDNFLLAPYIFSNSVRAHPLEIFVVTLAGAKLGGIGGMVIAIPAYTVLRVLLRTFFSEFEVIQNITKER